MMWVWGVLTGSILVVIAIVVVLDRE